MNRRHALRLGWVLGALLLAGVAQQAQATDTVVYYHTDALRSVAVVTNASGAVIERTHYAPYGQVLNRPLRDGPGYTGHQEDAATGLVYMQQRYYDPESGRFLSTDPVQVNANTGANFNRYWYAKDNPYRYTDPDGRQVVVIIVGACVESGLCEAGAYALLGAAAVKKVSDEMRSRHDHVMHSRSKPPSPLPEAEGRPRSIPDGKGGYTTYPSGKETEGKQYRPTGKPHGNIPRPNVKEWKPNVSPDGKVRPGKPTVRPPKPNEVPSHPKPPSPPPPKLQQGGS